MISVVFHTGAFVFEEDNFDDYLSILQTISVKEIIIDHCAYRQRWTFEKFELVADKFHISCVSMSSFEITEINIIDYINLLAKMKNCKVKLVDNYRGSYWFDLKNLELMIDHGIQIIEIGSSFLRTEGDIIILLKFAEVMRKMSFDRERVVFITYLIVKQ